MRICFIADSSSIHTQRIVSYYVNRGDQVFVMSSSRRRFDLPGTSTVHLVEDSVRAHRRPSAPKRKIGFSCYLKSFAPRGIVAEIKRLVRAFRLLRKRKLCLDEIRRINPDVIYCFRAFPEGVLASYCRVKPLLLRTAGQDISRLPRFPIYRQLIRRTLYRADAVVTESLWEKEFLVELCNMRITPEVNIIGVDTRLFQSATQRDSLRENYGLPPGSFVVVSNRYLNGHYNGWLVVEAVESIMQQCPNLYLLYVSPSKMDLRSRSRSESIGRRSPRITFIDGPLPHSEMPNLLACGDIYISFSSFDGIPNSVLEAMACGLVPIVAELPQLKEWIEEGITGYLVPQKNTQRLAMAVKRAYQNSAIIKNMSADCVSKIKERGSFESCSERTRVLLEDLVKSSPRQTTYTSPG